MKLTILYDNEAWHKNLKSDWGFSCLIETPGKNILRSDKGKRRSQGSRKYLFDRRAQQFRTVSGNQTG
jgi:hypothetical protein